MGTAHKRKEGRRPWHAARPAKSVIDTKPLFFPSITLPPAGETVADWALRPLFVSPISASGDADGATPPDAPPAPTRLCLSSPASPGGAVTVAACGVPGAAPGTAITFDVVDAPRGGGEGPALTLRAAPRPRQALPGGPPVSGDTTAASSIESGPQCLAALGAVVGLAPCGGPDTRWRAAPASAPDSDSPPSPAGRKAKGWTTHAGVMLVNPASGLCAVADGRLAACDAGGDGGRVFRLCSAPGACARFGVPPC